MVLLNTLTGILRAVRQVRTLSILKVRKLLGIVGEKHFTISRKTPRGSAEDLE